VCVCVYIYIGAARLQLLEVGREGGPVLAVLLGPDVDVARAGRAGEDWARGVVGEEGDAVLGPVEHLGQVANRVPDIPAPS